VVRVRSAWVSAIVLLAAVGCVTACASGGGSRSTAASSVKGAWGTARQVPGTQGGPVHVDDVRAVACAPGGDCVAAGYNSGIDGFVTADRDGTWGKAMPIPGLAALSTGEAVKTSEIYGLTCPAAGDCVVTGEFDSGEFQVPDTFVAQETKGTWGKAIPIPREPALKTSGLGGPGTVACASPGNCVLAGTYRPGHPYTQGSPTQAYVADEVNGTWRPATPIPGLQALNAGQSAYIGSLSCGSPGNCLVGGSYAESQTQQEPFLVSEVDGSWGKATLAPGYQSVAAAGDNGVIAAVSCVSAGDCVATGDMSPANGGTTDAFMIAEQGQAWATPSVLRGVEVLALACPVSGQCVAGGTDSHHVAAIATEANGQWNGQAEIPGAARLTSQGKKAIGSGVTALACPTAGQCVADGQYNGGGVAPGSPSGQPPTQVFLSDETTNSWGPAQVPAGLAALNTQSYADLAGLACAAAGNCAAGGYYSYAGGSQGATGAFTIAETPAGS
jgi:hypothetical protein